MSRVGRSGRSYSFTARLVTGLPISPPDTPKHAMSTESDTEGPTMSESRTLIPRTPILGGYGSQRLGRTSMTRGCAASINPPPVSRVLPSLRGSRPDAEGQVPLLRRARGASAP